MLDLPASLFSRVNQLTVDDPCGPSAAGLPGAGVNLEEDLQGELPPPGDITLATSCAELAVTQGRDGRTEENAVKDISGIALESNISALTEVGVLLDGKVLVPVPEPADILIFARRVAKPKLSWVGPRRRVQISVLVGIAKVSREGVRAADPVGKLDVVEEISPQAVVCHRDG